MEKEIRLVVIAFHNRPFALLLTLTRFSFYSRLTSTFWLMDNGSSIANRWLATLVMSSLVGSFKTVRRNNSGREAGAYWAAIQKIAQHRIPVKAIVFTQDKIHRRGVLPQNVVGLFSPINNRRFPYYPAQIRMSGICFSRLQKIWQLFPGAQIGFGGKRCAHGLRADARFVSNQWEQVVSEMDLEFFDYFSGACFAVDKEGLDLLSSLSPHLELESTEHFAHLWERLWGSVFSSKGFELVDYSSLDRDVWHSCGTDEERKGDWFSQSMGVKLDKDFLRQRLCSRG